MGGPARLLALLAVAAATARSRRLPIGSCPPIRVSWWPAFARRSPTKNCCATARRLASRTASRQRPVSRSPPPSWSARERCASRRISAAPKPARAAGDRRPGASAALRRLYAQVLQYRHAFAGRRSAARRRSFREAPHDDDARLLRASIRLVRGDFRRRARRLRPACRRPAAVLRESVSPASPRHWPAVASRAGPGFAGHRAPTRSIADPERVHTCSPRVPSCASALDDIAGAIADYRAALSAGAAMTIRSAAALADALAARGDDRRAARECWTIEKPSVALLVRAAALAQGAPRADSHRARQRVARARSRPRRCHARPRSRDAGAAQRRAARGAAAARRNFEVQTRAARRARAGARRQRGARCRRIAVLARVAARDRISGFRHGKHSRQRGAQLE